MLSLRTLLANSIDYAGLFPPAALGMEQAVRNYAEYRAGRWAWALGRFVVPVARLAELEAAAEPLLPRVQSAGWRLAALAGSDVAADLRALGEVNCRHAAEGAAALSADVVELKAGSVEAIETALRSVPGYLRTYVEIPIERDPAELIAAVARLGARAKVRTGGVTPNAFPSTENLVGFIRACVTAGVAFKATAGLHHPLRAEYRLTYAPDSERAPMYGFLNLFLAAAFMSAGMEDREAMRLLEDGASEVFRFDQEGVEWRGRRLNLEAIRAARERVIVSFGSCSFEEPIGELRGLGML